MTGNQAFILASGNGGGGMTREEVIELIHETVKTPMHFKGLVGEGGDILDLPSPLNKDGDTYLVNADGYYANLPAMYYKVKTTHVGEDWVVGDPIRVDIWAGIDDTFVTYTDHAITPSFKLNDPGPYYPNPIYSPEVIQYTYLNTNTFQIWAKTEGIIIEGRTIELNNEVDYWYTNGSKDSTVFKIDGGTTFAKKGDMFCSVGDKWVLIPSGDEEPGMVYGGTVKVSSSSIEADYTGLPSPSADTAGMMLTVKEEGTYATSAANYYTVKVSVGGSPYYACIADVYSDAARTQRVKTVTHDGTRETTVPVDNHISIECLSDGNYKIHNDAPVFDTDTTTTIGVDGYDALPYYAGGLTKNFSLSATKYAKVDDTFVCNGTEWILQNTSLVNVSIATDSTPGLVKPGTGLTINSEGRIDIIGGDDVLTLFNDGQFYNTDIAELVYDSNTEWQIQNGKLLLNKPANKSAAGLIVRTKANVPAGTVIIEIDAICESATDGWYSQTGRCTNSATYPGIVEQGAGRISYYSDSGWGKTTDPITFKLTETGNTDSVFLAMSNTQVWTIAIKKVYITTGKSVIQH